MSSNSLIATAAAVPSRLLSLSFVDLLIVIICFAIVLIIGF